MTLTWNVFLFLFFWAADESRRRGNRVTRPRQVASRHLKHVLRRRRWPPGTQPAILCLWHEEGFILDFEAAAEPVCDFNIGTWQLWRECTILCIIIIIEIVSSEGRPPGAALASL